MEFKLLKTILEKHQLWANKSLGQHFLHDEAICKRMVKHLQLKEETVVEIGPGPGSLTDILLKERPKFFLAIEKDQRFIDILKEFTVPSDTTFEVVQADALNTSIAKLLQDKGQNGPYHIVANLPYNIGTELLINWIDDIANIASITVMLQKEVVDRMRAKVGGGDYGRLAIILQSCFEVQELFRISPQAFIPQPKVFSSVVYLKPKQNIPSTDVIKTLEKLTALAFCYRRKMLRSSLGKSLPSVVWQEICDMLKLDETKRPEQIDVQTFIAMANLCNNKI